jgi:pterin-4a-carbinolamine dehydratase
MTNPIPDLKTLANKHCTTRPKAVDEALLADILRESLNHWNLLRKPTTIAAVIDDGVEIEPAQSIGIGEPMAIERTFVLNNFRDALALVNSLSNMIHREDHHPEILLSGNRCRIKWETHSINGLSMNDLVCAAKCDSIAQRNAGVVPIE